MEYPMVVQSAGYSVAWLDTQLESMLAGLSDHTTVVVSVDQLVDHWDVLMVDKLALQ